MKSKLVIIGLMICSVFALSVSAQITTSNQLVVLQDDKSGDHLEISIATGEYKFESCNNNLAISGSGKVGVSGCTVELQDISDTRRVVAEVDLCSASGKADVVFVNEFSTRPKDEPVEFVLSDSNTRDSVFDCRLKQETK
ncbi:MAG TPA: hypothetical protein VKN18_11900 [Blastocatellia bacterium]|nr:hypothetical protein [Blastocatellia bacterium]